MQSDHSLSDAVERAHELLVGVDGLSRHDIEHERNGRQHSGPRRTEVDCSPRPVAYYLRDHEEADIPAHYQQGIEHTEKHLGLAVVVDEDGIGTKGGRRQQDGEERPHVEMVVADRVGEPEVEYPGHLHASSAERAYLHTKTDDGQYDCRHQEKGLFTLPHQLSKFWFSRTGSRQ